MIGICAIAFKGGYSVSNDCVFDADKHLVVEGDKKYSKQVLTIKINAIFDVKGTLVEGEKVECLFKSVDDKKMAFIGTVKSRGKQLTVVHELVKIDVYKEILNKIKQWQILKT